MYAKISRSKQPKKPGFGGFWTKSYLRGAFLWVLIVTFLRAAAGTPIGRIAGAIHRHFAPHRNSALLIAIVVAFAVHALIGDTGASNAVFGIALVLLLLVALYNINIDELVGERDHLPAPSRRRRMLGWALASAAAAERLTVIFVHKRTLDLVGSTRWLLFILFVTLTELRGVLKQRDATAKPSAWRSQSTSCSALPGRFCTV